MTGTAVMSAALCFQYPLKEVVVVNEDKDVLRDVDSLRDYILDELNVRNLTVTSDKEAYSIAMKARPDIKALGIRLKKDSKAVCAAIDKLSNADLVLLQTQGTLYQPLTHSDSHSLSLSLTHSDSHSLSLSLTQPLTHSASHSLSLSVCLPALTVTRRRLSGRTRT